VHFLRKQSLITIRRHLASTPVMLHLAWLFLTSKTKHHCRCRYPETSCLWAKAIATLPISQTTASGKSAKLIS